MTAIAVTFALTVTIIVGLYWVVVERPDVARERAVQRRLQPAAGQMVAHVLVMPHSTLSSLNWLDRTLTRMSRVTEPLREMLNQAALKMTVGTVLLSCAFLALAFGVATSYLIRVPLLPYLTGAMGAAVPILVVRHLANKRLIAFEQHFPAAVDLMARSLRAGHALSTALELVGKEIPDPIGTEFRLLFEQQNYGMSLADALRAFAKRVPLLDARFFATAVLTQREVGGNLSEILENLSAVMRERFKVKRDIRVASAHGRITGWILGLLAPTLAVILSAMSPALMQELFRDPLGIRLVIGAVVLEVLGVVFIRRIVNVEF